MKILAFSDIHTDFEGAERLAELSGEADVVVGAGDFCAAHHGLEEMIKVLGAIETPSLVVPGNNETDTALRAATASYWPSARVLHGEGTVLGGVPFFGLGGGIPTTPWGWSHDLTEYEAEALLEEAPAGGVLILHSPPKGYADGRGGGHFGSEAILAAIQRHTPQWAFCGHIHECWGEEHLIGATHLLNCGPSGRFVTLGE
ncbi:metallophosphoesterase family protein [bacterium]|nr:metallophosphoesterase family protein [bacterium]